MPEAIWLAVGEDCFASLATTMAVGEVAAQLAGGGGLNGSKGTTYVVTTKPLGRVFPSSTGTVGEVAAQLAGGGGFCVLARAYCARSNLARGGGRLLRFARNDNGGGGGGAQLAGGGGLNGSKGTTYVVTTKPLAAGQGMSPSSMTTDISFCWMLSCGCSGMGRPSGSRLSIDFIAMGSWLKRSVSITLGTIDKAICS